MLDRNAIQTYVEFGSDAERIGAIGKVFPFIFFLVAALVSLTTMTRMVEEQRLQIAGIREMEHCLQVYRLRPGGHTGRKHSGRGGGREAASLRHYDGVFYPV